MKRLFTADYHLGDDRMEILGRPFHTGEDCAHKILQNVNFNIDMGATELFVVGDLAIDEKWLERFDQSTNTATRRVLIKGNYDRLPDETYLQVFDEVLEYLDMDIEHDGEKLPVRLHHYPTRYATADRFSICGHIHSAWKVQKNMLNVGVDAHHFRPIDEQKILFYYKAICGFYDQDVWVHDHPANDHNKDRGKAGTYWETNFAGSHGLQK